MKKTIKITKKPKKTLTIKKKQPYRRTPKSKYA